MGSRLSLIMSDDLEQIVREMAKKEHRFLGNQLYHLVKLGLKCVENENEIKHTVKIPEGWEVVSGGRGDFNTGRLEKMQ